MVDFVAHHPYGFSVYLTATVILSVANAALCIASSKKSEATPEAHEKIAKTSIAFNLLLSGLLITLLASAFMTRKINATSYASAKL